ncbi:phenylalanine--tRNA ligase subunit beta [Haloarcula montana]|uniref:phenylalanine--tRNA ligase subunit beta n=1 Tax=Haloarcula montana TaxID=3111776 RepID=UPI002D778576|nr:phenylalanine--tRNA ligase subunit beta [Haloarcula sp. GH36]
MPVVDVDPDELRRLTGHDEKDDEELRSDLFDLGLEFEGLTEDDEFQLEFAPDRLDRLSVEGVARSLRYHYGDDRGVYVPSTNSAEWTIEVEDQPAERPYVTGAVVRGLDMGEDALESLIQVQEKLHATMGRKRAKGAIGVHDLTMLKGAPATEGTGKSITYTSVDPDEDTFVPLDADREMTPNEVVADHETGQTYGDLVADFDRVPAIYDSIGLFSFPPVINGQRTEVSENSRDLFIEMTGTDQWTIDHMLNIVCYALEARGGTVERVAVEYGEDAPGEYAGRTLDRPDFSTRTKTVSHERIESILGVSLDEREVIDYAERAGLDAEETRGDDLAYDVEIPPYRVDVLHPLDVIDDIGRALGFNSLEPTYPDVSTVGGRHDRSRLEDAARDALVGLGFEDLLNFHMTNEAENFERMGLSVPRTDERASGDNREQPDDDCLGAADPVTIQEPYSEDYTILRTWALPSLLMVLENNTHRRYPQDLAEIGLAAHVDDDVNTGAAERRTVAGVLARTDASYEDAKARLQTLAESFDAELETPPTSHPSFISGRAAEVVLDGGSVGVLGEIHPKVLVEHDLELPVAAFEFRLDGLE